MRCRYVHEWMRFCDLSYIYMAVIGWAARTISSKVEYIFIQRKAWQINSRIEHRLSLSCKSCQSFIYDTLQICCWIFDFYSASCLPKEIQILELISRLWMNTNGIFFQHCYVKWHEKKTQSINCALTHRKEKLEKF